MLKLKNWLGKPIGDDIISEIYVVDAMMGMGKTSAVINYINSSHPNDRFIFITPYLTEVERIKTSCAGKNFVEPTENATKTEDLRNLILKRKNIVTTHALFLKLTDNVLRMIKKRGYTLIMDEVVQLVDEVAVSSGDYELVNSMIDRGKDERLKWKKRSYNGVFGNYKYIIDTRDTYDACWQNAFISFIKKDIFTSFEKVFVLTYLFESQIQGCYFKFYGLDYNRLYIKNENGKYELTEEVVDYQYPDLSKLIHICDNKKLNSVGDGMYDLSVSWYNARENAVKKSRLKDNCFNYFHNIVKSKASNNLWTCFKENQNELKGKGYSKGYAPINMRASNEYRNRNCVAYLVNRFPNTVIYNFFSKRGVSFNRDAFALSEMLQFIWRSAIRDDKEIWVYVPSSRMRSLLVEWLENPKKFEEAN